jgi:hypothetical protein
MASHQTKLKVARKLDDVDTSVASDNRISALFRYDEEDGTDGHVSISIESDAMEAEDVWAVFQLLHDRGVLTAQQTKTWLHQPKASRERFGDTTEWQGEDLAQKVDMMKRGLTVRGGEGGPDAQARNKQAVVQLSELERSITEVKETLQGAEEDGGEADDGPTPPDAL